MFISVHFPKSGGTSLRISLEKAFGRDALLLNYADDPVDPGSRYSMDPEYIHRTETKIPETIKIVHGHFSPRRYADVTYYDGLFTFLREPVENIISIYFFWKSFPRNSSIIHSYFLDNDLTLEQFATMPRLRYLYTQSYFPGFEMEKFDLIGDMTTYDRDIGLLARLIDRPLEIVTENVNRNRSAQDDSQFNYFTAMGDKSLRARLENILADDLRFYESVMRLRENLKTI